MPRGKKPYSAEVRAAVIADLATGNSVRYVARKHHLSAQTVAGWRDEAGIKPQVSTRATEDFGELIADYLRRTLRALAAQTDTFADPAWIEKQSAGELAELHGGLLDRAVTILAALERAQSTPPAGYLDAAGPPDPA